MPQAKQPPTSIRNIRQLAMQLGRARATVGEWVLRDDWPVSATAPWGSAELRLIQEWRREREGEIAEVDPEHLRWARAAGFDNVSEYARALREQADAVERDAQMRKGAIRGAAQGSRRKAVETA